MGWAKEEISRLEGCSWAAKEIAVRAEVLRRCDLCDDYGHACLGELPDAYRVGNAAYSRGEALVGEFRDRREMTDTIKRVVEQAPEVCEHERRIRARD